MKIVMPINENEYKRDCQNCYQQGYADGSLSVTEEIKDKVIDECIEILKKMKGE